MKKRKIFFALITILLTALLASAQQAETVEIVGGGKIVGKIFEEKNAERMFEITAEYPEIVGLDSPGARRFNQSAKALVMEQVEDFRSAMMKMDAEELESAREREAGNYAEIGYSVMFAGENILSLVFGNSQYTGGAHPNSQSLTLNFDLKNGRQLNLSDLFIVDSNYLKIISEYSIKSLEKDLDSPEDDWIRRGAGADAKNFANWNLTKEGLIIIFDSYQVAAYAAGPQEVLIPFGDLRDILKVFDFEPLQYANSGNPVNWCRNGLFPQNSENFRIAKIESAKNEKVFFYEDQKEDCPKNENCKTKSYVISGDEVIISRTYGKYACAWFQPEKGSETVGWIALDKLKFVENAENTPWLGDWTFYDNSVKIAAIKSEEKLKITGNALWKGLGDNIHVGEIDFAGTPENGRLELGESGDFECRVKMQRVGKFLIVSDNSGCGGVNVTFNGVYQKK